VTSLKNPCNSKHMKMIILLIVVIWPNLTKKHKTKGFFYFLLGLYIFFLVSFTHAYFQLQSYELFRNVSILSSTKIFITWPNSALMFLLHCKFIIMIIKKIIISLYGQE